MKNKKSSSPPIIGGNSLLLIFAALCLTILTLLMLHTARVNGRMTSVSAKATADYYKADMEAMETIAQIRSGKAGDNVTEENGEFSFECEISPDYLLSVKVKMAEGRWEVVKWQTYSKNR